MPGEVSIYISCVHFARKTQKQRRQLQYLIRHLMCSKYNGKHRQYKGTLIILGYSGVWKACNVNLSHCVEAYCPTLVELVLKGTWWTMDIHQKSDSLWTRLLSRIKQNLATFEKVVESTSPPPWSNSVKSGTFASVQRKHIIKANILGFINISLANYIYFPRMLIKGNVDQRKQK